MTWDSARQRSEAIDVAVKTRVDEERIPVLRDAHLKGWPKNADGGRVKYLKRRYAFTEPFDTDAHFASYAAPEVERRITLDVLDRTDCLAKIGGSLAMVLATFDVDCEIAHKASGGVGDAPAPDRWWLDEIPKLEGLGRDHPGAFVYRTRGGYRIVFRLADPIHLRSPADAETWSRRYIEWVAYLETYLIFADPSCSDAVRLMRLPRATRDGSKAPERREMRGDAARIGSWNPIITSETAARAKLIRPPKSASTSVERVYRPRPGSIESDPGNGVFYEIFRARGQLEESGEVGKWNVVCPWNGSHTKGMDLDGSTILFAPHVGDRWGWPHCSHGHCQHRTLRDWFDALGAETIQRVELELTQRAREQAERALSERMSAFTQAESFADENAKKAAVTIAISSLFADVFDNKLEPESVRESLAESLRRLRLPPKWVDAQKQIARDQLKPRLDIDRTSDTVRIADCVDPSLFIGDPQLELPPGFFIDVNGAFGERTLTIGDVGQRVDGVNALSSHAFWPIEQVSADVLDLHIVAVVRQQLRHVSIPNGSVTDSRRLGGLLRDHGIDVSPDKKNLDAVSQAIHAMVRINESRIPRVSARWTTGWNADRTNFLLGTRCIGGEDRIHRLDEDESAVTMTKALRKSGHAHAWKETADAMLRAAPISSLLLAASVASPMLDLFSWPPICILLGALGGAGKSSLLRLAGSVWGFTGPAGSRQPAGIVGNAGGTSKGILMQFRRMAHLPHLADELKPDLVDGRKKDELASVLHQLGEGREHVRATRDSRATKSGWRFPGCVVLAGEVDGEDFLRKSGVLRRYLLPHGPYVAAGAHLGAFVESLATHYGHLGDELVTALVDTTESTRATWCGRVEEHRVRLLERLTVQLRQDERFFSWAMQFAVGHAAIDVAAELCPTTSPNPTLWRRTLDETFVKLQGEFEAEEGSDLALLCWDGILGWLAQQRANLLPSDERLLRRDTSHVIHENGKLPLPGMPMDGFQAALEGHARLSHEAAKNRTKEADKERVAMLMRTPREPIGKIVEAIDEGGVHEQILTVDVLQSALIDAVAAQGRSFRTWGSTFVARGWIEPDKATSDQRGLSRRTRIHGAQVRVYRLHLRAAHTANGVTTVTTFSDTSQSL